MSSTQTKPAYWLGMTAFSTIHWYSGEWNPSLNIAACGAKSSGNTVPYIKHGRYSVCRDCFRKLARRGVIVLPQLHAAIAEYQEFYNASTGFGVASDRQQQKTRVGDMIVMRSNEEVDSLDLPDRDEMYIDKGLFND